MKSRGKGCTSSGQLDCVISGNAISCAEKITSTCHTEGFKNAPQNLLKGLSGTQKNLKNHPTYCSRLLLSFVSQN